MADYTKYARKAAQKLGKYQSGSFAYVEPATAGATPYDPVTPGAEHAINGGIATAFKASQYSERLSSATMRIVFPQIDPVTGSAIAFEPVEAGQVKVDGTTLEIVAVEKSLAAGDILVWRIYAKG